jgi:predicted DNA-binding antitoxin AbrB/MazE fold protein
MIVIDAVFRQGSFVPTGPVPFAENEQVRLEITSAPVELSDEEFVRRLEECQTLEEIFALRQCLPPDDGSYDLEASLRENRRLAGDYRATP